MCFRSYVWACCTLGFCNQLAWSKHQLQLLRQVGSIGSCSSLIKLLELIKAVAIFLSIRSCLEPCNALRVSSFAAVVNNVLIWIRGFVRCAGYTAKWLHLLLLATLITRWRYIESCLDPYRPLRTSDPFTADLVDNYGLNKLLLMLRLVQ